MATIFGDITGLQQRHRLFTVLFSRKIIAIQRFALQAAILHEGQRTVWEEARKIEGL